MKNRCILIVVISPIISVLTRHFWGSNFFVSIIQNRDKELPSEKNLSEEDRQKKNHNVPRNTQGGVIKEWTFHVFYGSKKLNRFKIADKSVIF